MPKVIILILILTLSFSPCYPEIIKLKNGNTVEGKIIEKTEEYIKINFFDVPLKYDYDQIESIDEKATIVVQPQLKPLSRKGDDIENDFTRAVIKGFLALQNPATNLSPSHWGHPDYEDIAFIYDQAVEALIFKAVGYQAEAEAILDYFARRLHIPEKEMLERLDTNKIYGILKQVDFPNSSQGPLRAIINAVDTKDKKPQGKARLEFLVTPGPTSFLIFGFLGVNSEKYRDEAFRLGEVLLSMQNADGGIHDGDRSLERVHTEPHMDVYAAFKMLYEISGDRKWKEAAEGAYRWFENNVYHPDKGFIDQGVWSGRPSTIFATDVYSWTMAGPAGEKIQASLLKKITKNMLKQNLVKIKLSLPDGSDKTVILCDFSNAKDKRVIAVRKGNHPMGSLEWTGGVILALEKNAVRFYEAGDIIEAKFYKALAEELFSETKKCFYRLDQKEALIGFYATGQGIEVGPFGSIQKETVTGWKTPFFYVKDKDSVKVKGGSTVSAWALLPYLGLNPFILNDKFKSIYSEIKLSPADVNKAQKFLAQALSGRVFEEKVPSAVSDDAPYVAEPEFFNRKMWEALETAQAAEAVGSREKAMKYYHKALNWANKTVNENTWLEKAKSDNILKKKEIGGIISYPWGITYHDNNHPLHFAILRYPLLNEVGAAYWGLVTANFALGNEEKTLFWIERIIDEVPLHQIPDASEEVDGSKIIRGYWHALESWENISRGYEGNPEIEELYRKVLQKKGLTSARPETILLTQ